MFIVQSKKIRDNLISNHQFGFRKQHARIKPVHRVAKNMKYDLKHKKYCSAAFLDVTQDFEVYQ